MKFAHLLLFLAAISTASYAQDTTSAPSPQPAATSASKPKPAQAPPVTEKKKPKKVWTNEDLGSVKGSVSVVGDQNNSDDELDAQKAYVASGNENVRQRRIAMVRNQIQQLQGQLDAIDKRISQLRNFKGENTSPSGGINPSQGYNMVPLQEQVKQLEDRKKQIQAQIQDLEADARKNGIEPGDLR